MLLYSTIETSRNYTDQQVTDAHGLAIQYTDQQALNISVSATNYTDQQVTDAHGWAIQHTDSSIANLRADVDQNEADADAAIDSIQIN